MPRPKKVYAPDEQRRCSRCGTRKALDQFRFLKRYRKGIQQLFRDSWCVDCRREYKHTPEYRAVVNDRNVLRRLTDPVFREQCRLHGENNKGLNREYERKKRLANPEAAKKNYLDSRLRKKFGIGLLEYDQMMEAQDGRCAICGQHDRTKTRRLSVDHDHLTDKVRALLCHHCNTGLGNFGDDPALLMKAIAYLVSHSQIREVS